MNQRDKTDHDAGSDDGSIAGSVQWRVVLRDLLLVAAWVAVVSVGWGFLDWPMWAYYVVVFGGILGYSIANNPFEPTRGHS